GLPPRRLERLDRVADADAAGVLDVEVDAEVELAALAQAAVAPDPRERVQRAEPRVGIVRRDRAAPHGPADADDRLADAHARPAVLLVRARAVDLEQHPEAPRVDLRAERLAEPRARGARDERADVDVRPRPRLVRPDELERRAGVLRERLRPRPDDEAAGHLPPPEARPHGLAELDLAAHLPPAGEAQQEPAAGELGADAHERAEVLAVEERPARDQVEAPVLLRPAQGQLDLVRVLQPEALHRRDVDARDARHVSDSVGATRRARSPPRRRR